MFIALIFSLLLPHAGHDFRGSPSSGIHSISTHVPHAGHDRIVQTRPFRYYISTHVPHAGHDPIDEFIVIRTSRFQLTCPMRGTTEHSLNVRDLCRISTHVPHAGHDPAE